MSWLFYAVSAAVALAAADILIKAAVGKVPNSLGMLLYGSVPFTAGLIWWWFDRRNVETANITTKGVTLALSVGVMFAIVTYCMYAAFRAHAPLSLASPLIRLGGLVIASVVGVAIWKEPMTLRYVGGLAMVCGGIYFMLTR